MKLTAQHVSPRRRGRHGSRHGQSSHMRDLSHEVMYCADRDPDADRFIVYLLYQEHTYKALQ
jgi:hypothetical protein